MMDEVDDDNNNIRLLRTETGLTHRIPLRTCFGKGHIFMTSTKNQVFDPLPLSSVSTCVHVSLIDPLPLCGRPHEVDTKYTSLS